jgi:hypothetical protein
MVLLACAIMVVVLTVVGTVALGRPQLPSRVAAATEDGLAVPQRSDDPATG